MAESFAARGLFLISTVTVLIALWERKRRFQTHSQVDNQFGVIRLVGWTFGIVGAPESLEPVIHQVKALANVIKQENRTVVITWDGDLKAEDSFTCLLESLYQGLPQDTLFIAHVTEANSWNLRHSEPSGFSFVKESFHSLDFKYHSLPKPLPRFLAVTVPFLHNYDDLARLALEWIRDKTKVRKVTVMCVGGGRCIRNEVKEVRSGNFPNLHVQHVNTIPKLQRLNQGTLENFTSLLESARPKQTSVEITFS